jgi:hypothetical protein
MNQITHITQTESSTRIFFTGKLSFLIEDWNKSLNNFENKQAENENKK